MSRSIFLSLLPESDALLFKKIVKVIQRANMKPIYISEKNATEKKDELIQQSDVILNIITPTMLAVENKKYYKEIQSLNNHSEIIAKKPVIVWCSRDLLKALRKSEDFKTIESLKKLISNQHFISYTSMIKLVDDLRTIKLGKEERVSKKLYDITFIANENDKKSAEQTQLLINDILKINSISVDFSSNTNYATTCSESILNSDLCVVFSKNATEWAINFAQQTWKIIGGASSQVPILVIFDKDKSTSKQVTFEVPNIYKLFTEDSLAGLEIKMFYDKLMQN